MFAIELFGSLFLEFLGLVALSGVIFEKRLLIRICLGFVALALLAAGTYGLSIIWNSIPGIPVPSSPDGV